MAYNDQIKELGSLAWGKIVSRRYDSSHQVFVAMGGSYRKADVDVKEKNLKNWSSLKVEWTDSGGNECPIVQQSTGLFLKRFIRNVFKTIHIWVQVGLVDL